MTTMDTPKKNDIYRVDQPRFMTADEIAQTCGNSVATRGWPLLNLRPSAGAQRRGPGSEFN